MVVLEHLMPAVTCAKVDYLVSRAAYRVLHIPTSDLPALQYCLEQTGDDRGDLELLLFCASQFPLGFIHTETICLLETNPLFFAGMSACFVLVLAVTGLDSIHHDGTWLIITAYSIRGQ